MMNYDLKPYHLYTAKILLSKIYTTTGGEKPVIFYGNISEETKRHAFTEVPKDIAKISLICNQLNLPLISVLVVNQNKNIPGPGFYDLWRELKEPESQMTDADIFQSELYRVMQCREWYRLEAELKLEKGKFTKDYIPVNIVTADIIGKDYEFQDYDRDLKDIRYAKDMRKERTNRHQQLVRLIGARLSDEGYKLYEGIMDCAAVKMQKKTLLIEVKTLCPDGSDELYQVRNALSQLLYYKEFHLNQIPNTDNNLHTIVFFEHKVDNKYIEFLKKYNCYTIWKKEDGEISSNINSLLR